MKKIFYLLALFTGIAQAQIVNIPDANFKAKLIALGLDADSDGQIQQSEIASVANLDIKNLNITDLTGIESFTGLVTLDCSNNAIATPLNLTALTQLRSLSCNNNQIPSIDVSGLSQLWDLFCYNNQLTSINTTGADAVIGYNCSNNNLTSISISNMYQLYSLFCDNNQFTTLDLAVIRPYRKLNASIIPTSQV